MGEARRRKSAARAGALTLPTEKTLLQNLKIPLLPDMPELPADLNHFLLKLAATTRATLHIGIAAAQRSKDQAEDAIVSAIKEIHSIYTKAEKEVFSSPEGAALAAQIACATGCVFCCHLNVQTTIPEVFALAKATQVNSGQIARIVSTAEQISQLSELERYAGHIPCPMLEQGSCSHYEIRPFACRGHNSDLKELCAEDFDRVSRGLPSHIQYIGITKLIANAVSAGIKRSLVDQHLQADSVELSMALSIIHNQPDALSRWLSGERIFSPFRT